MGEGEAATVEWLLPLTHAPPRRAAGIEPHQDTARPLWLLVVLAAAGLALAGAAAGAWAGLAWW